MKNTLDTDQNFHFNENLEGRIRNLSLSPNAHNSMFPMFEAISNSIHSIEEQFNGDLKKGKITIELFRNERGWVRDIAIRDNGIGLNEKNFNSFRTYDSGFKIQKGGKGVGRLTWLKVFKNAQVTSIYLNKENLEKRSFVFSLNNKNAFTNHQVTSEKELTTTETEVRLEEMQSNYISLFPKKLDSIANNIIGHFLNLLIAPKSPVMEIIDGSKFLNLNKEVNNSVMKTKKEEFEISSGDKLTIQHIILDSRITESNLKHSLFFLGDSRTVEINNISSQLGLRKTFIFEEKNAKYIGVIYGKIFDENISQERNRFIFSSKTFAEFYEYSIIQTKIFLEEQIQKVKERQSIILNSVINNYPLLKTIAKGTDELLKMLPLNANTKETVYSTLSIQKHRYDKRFKASLMHIMQHQPKGGEIEKFDQEIKHVISKATRQKTGTLEEYIKSKQDILNLLKSFLKSDPATSKSFKEEKIHRLICPMGITSETISDDDHNLWILEEYLSHYSYWASDLALNKFTTSSSASRPDLFYLGAYLINEKNISSVNIVEFKRPNREEYPPNENPIDQIRDYIFKLRNENCTDLNGQFIGRISNETPFYCFLIADISTKLMKMIDHAQGRALPGGKSFEIHYEKDNILIKVIPYQVLLDENESRHRAYFDFLDRSSTAIR